MFEIIKRNERAILQSLSDLAVACNDFASGMQEVGDFADRMIHVQLLGAEKFGSMAGKLELRLGSDADRHHAAPDLVRGFLHGSGANLHQSDG